MNNFNQFGTINPQQSPFNMPLVDLSALQQLRGAGNNNQQGLGQLGLNSVLNNNNQIVNKNQGGFGNWFGKGMDWLGSGNNMETLAGIGQTLAGLYMGNKQLKLGERALGLQESAFNNNLEHTIKSYNTKLADQAKARGFTQGQSQAEIDSHIANNSLKRV